MAILTTTRAEIPHRRITEVLGVVLGEGDGIIAAFGEMEEAAIDYEADAIIDVRMTTAAAAFGRQQGTTVRWGLIGTAVRLHPAQLPK